MKNETSFSSRSSGAHQRAPLGLSWRFARLLALIAALLPVIIALVRWLREDDVNSAVTNSSVRPALEAIGAQSIIVRENGHKLWEFSADRITWSADHRTATATNLRRGVLFRAGKPFLTMSATRVVLNQESRNWQASGHLQANGPDGFSISTDRATWSQRRERLTCPDAVSAKLRGLQIQTRDVFYEAKTGQLKCPQPVEVRSAQATIREGRDVVADIRARRVEFRSGVDITIKRSALDAVLSRPKSRSRAAAVDATSSALRLSD